MGRARMAITPGTVTAPAVTTRHRVLAILALGADLLLLVAVLVFLLNHGVELVFALLGLALAVVGGWWMVTEEMPRRGFGIAGLVVGFALIVLAILRAATTRIAPARAAPNWSWQHIGDRSLRLPIAGWASRPHAPAT